MTANIRKTAANPAKPAKQPKPAKAAGPDSKEAVDAFLAELDHPQKAAMEALRKVIVAVDPKLGEGIKWNAPSFKLREYFATFNFRGKDGLMLVLHQGAKATEASKSGLTIDDPSALLKWLGKERAVVTFADAADVKTKSAALTKVLKQWIKQLP